MNGLNTLGLNEDGKDCIEGLLPQFVLSNVYSTNTDLVMKLTASDSQKRKSAKNELKSKLLQEFKSSKNIQASDLKGFKPFFSNTLSAFK